MKRVSKGQPGFALVEFLVVILVIACVAAFIMPNVARKRARSSVDSCAQNLKDIATAVHSYRQEHGDRLPLQQQAQEQGRSSGGDSVDSAYLGIVPRYLAAGPHCPSNALVDYWYEFCDPRDGNGTFFRLTCNNVDSHKLVGVPSEYPRYVEGNHAASGDEAGISERP